MAISGIVLVIIIVLLIASWFFRFKRTLVAEVITAGILIVTVFAVDVVRVIIEGVTNAFLTGIGLLVSRLQGQPFNAPNFSFGTAGQFTNLVIILAGGLLAFAIGGHFGKTAAVKHPFWAYIVRVLNLMLLAAALLGQWVNVVGPVPGQDLLAGTNIVPPAITLPALFLTANTSRNPLSGSLPWLVGLLVGILIIYALLSLFFVPPQSKPKPGGKPQTRFVYLLGICLMIGIVAAAAIYGIPRLSR